MRTTSKEQLAELQKCPASIRNICILAHVDHGKYQRHYVYYIKSRNYEKW